MGRLHGFISGRDGGELVDLWVERLIGIPRCFSGCMVVWLTKRRFGPGVSSRGEFGEVSRVCDFWRFFSGGRVRWLSGAESRDGADFCWLSAERATSFIIA